MDAKCKQFLNDIYYSVSSASMRFFGPSGLEVMSGELSFTFLKRFKASKQWVEGASKEDQVRAFAKFLASEYELADSIVVGEEGVEHTLPVLPVKMNNCLFLEGERRVGQLFGPERGLGRCLICSTLTLLIEEDGTQKTFVSGTTQEGNQCRSSIFLIPLLEKEAELLGRLEKI